MICIKLITDGSKYICYKIFEFQINAILISKFPNNIKKHNCFIILLFIERNVSLAPNQNIRMISEGSCDTEVWSNDAEIQLCHHIAFKNVLK